MAAVYADCAAVWSRAPIVTADCAAVWRAAPAVAADCAATWQDGVPVWADCAAVWAHQAPVSADCAAVWRHAAGPVWADCAAMWQHVDDPPQPPDPPTPPVPPTPAPQPDNVRLSIGGVELDPVRISLAWSREQSVIEADVELPDDAAYAAARGETANLELWGYTFKMLIDGRSRSESFGAHTWTLRLASPAAGLDLPWADGVEGELSGQASAIARRLAGDIPLTWSAVDWRIGPGRWIANGESPLALLQTLASAVGAAVNSRPDGGLVVAPLYPVSPLDWASATPAAVLTAAGEVISLATGEESRDGINAITVSDAGETSQSVLRLEEDQDKRRGGTTEVLVYQAPWRNDFTVTHRGDPSKASVQFMALEEPVVADEEIIVQDGKGSAQYPVYAVIGARWNWRNLGTPTFAESGEITVEPKDESILLLTYRTRRKRYKCTEVNMTDLLVVAEDEA